MQTRFQKYRCSKETEWSLPSSVSQTCNVETFAHNEESSFLCPTHWPLRFLVFCSSSDLHRLPTAWDCRWVWHRMCVLSEPTEEVHYHVSVPPCESILSMWKLPCSANSVIKVALTHWAQIYIFCSKITTRPLHWSNLDSVQCFNHLLPSLTQMEQMNPGETQAFLSRQNHLGSQG